MFTAAAAVNPSVIKTLLTSGLNTFFIYGKPVCNNGPRSLAKNTLGGIILVYFLITWY